MPRKHVLPWLLRFNDWELLRRSPVPVLLVKRAQPWRKPGVLAAIDPLHSFAKPARLDGEIMACGADGGRRARRQAAPGACLPGRAAACRTAQPGFGGTGHHAGAAGHA